MLYLMYNNVQATVKLSKFVINFTFSLATIISWEGRPYKERSSDTNKMNELSFFITSINNLLKLGSCSCDWVCGAFGYETSIPVFFFFWSIFSWLLITIHKNQGLRPYDKWSNDIPNQVHSLIDWYRKWRIWNQNLLNLSQKLSSPTSIPWIFMPSII